MPFYPIMRLFCSTNTKKKDIESALAFQAEPLLPFPPEDAVITHTKIGSTEKGTLLTFFAISKEKLGKQLSHFREMGIEPEVITPPSEALTHLATSLQNEPSTLPSLILHIGIDETLCVLEQGGKVLGTRAIDIGTASLSESLESGQIEEVNVQEEPNIKASITNLKQEISRTIFSLLKQYKTQKISQLLLTGHGSTLQGMKELIAEDLQIAVVTPEGAFGQPAEVVQEFALSIGLALLALDDRPLNFRKQEFAYSDPLKRLKLPIFAYLGACLLLTSVFLMLSSLWNTQKTKQITQTYAETLQAIERPYTEFERAFADQHFDTPKLPEELTEVDLVPRIEYLEQTIQNSPETFELLPDVPKVSDLLAWLSTHERVVGDQPLITIESLQYTLVKRPEEKKKGEKYRVKVDLDFTANSPTAAREFHDALIESNPFVDPKGEVKWGNTATGWRTSFFLKNKPPKKKL